MLACFAAGLYLLTEYWRDVLAFFPPSAPKRVAADSQFVDQENGVALYTPEQASQENALVPVLEAPEESSLVYVPEVVNIRRGRDGTIRSEVGFLMGSSFIENMIAWRTVGIEGRLGGGKTLLSVALAKWLYEHHQVRGVFSNFPIDPDYIPYVPSCINTCVILDEGAEWADARDSAKGHKGYGKYFRKLGSYMLSPSVYAVDRRMRPVTVERNLDLFMLGWWLYNWKDPRGAKGWFVFSGFESIFNKYDHRFIPADDGGILDTMKEEIKQLAGSRRKLYVVGDVPRLVNPYANPLEGKQ
jgi:hypothetical protein